MSKILIVEDDEKLRNELEKFLKNNGYEVESLKLFNNTLNDILKINLNLLLLDINLPETDVVLMKKLMKLKIKSHILILIVFLQSIKML